VPERLAPGHAGTMTVTLNSTKIHDYGLTQTSVYLASNPGDKVSADNEIPVSTILLPSFVGVTAAQKQYAPKMLLSKKQVDIQFGGKSKKKDIIEITDVADGEVSIKPLAAGKTTIAVKEPGGKNAKLNVSVVQPVESVTLTVKGNIKPGGSVNVAADLQPKQAGNKNLEWSVDVGEDVATINAKGQVKISKEAASGTKITVTCKALGSPEPIVSTTEIEIP
jgi:hypothetical protein